MVRKPLLLVLLFAASLAWADSGYRPPAVTVSEVDGNPKRRPVQELEFSNGTVTITGNKATIVTGGGGAATVQIPQTAVAFGTSSNTVTGDSTTFSWTATNQTLTIGGTARSSFVQGSHAIEILNAELAGGRPNLLITTGSGLLGPLALQMVNSSGSVTLGVSSLGNPLVGAGNGYIGTDGIGGAFYLTPSSVLGFGIDASSATFFTRLQAKGTVDISSGLTTNNSAGSLYQQLISSGTGTTPSWQWGRLVQQVFCTSTSATTTTTSNVYQRDNTDCTITPKVLGSTITITFYRSMRTDNALSTTNMVTMKRDDGTALTDIGKNGQPVVANNVGLSGVVDLLWSVNYYDVVPSSGIPQKYIPYFRSTDGATTVRMGWFVDNAIMILGEWK